MKDDNAGKRYHPALRTLIWAVPLAAVAIILFLQISSRRHVKGTVEIRPPATASIPYLGHAEVDSLITGGSGAFERGDYNESARLLTRARFFIRAGISENIFGGMPRNLELILGLSEYYRGYPAKGIEAVTHAAASDPRDSTYAWYLALMHLLEGNRAEGEWWLEKASSLSGIHADSAREMLEKL